MWTAAKEDKESQRLPSASSYPANVHWEPVKEKAEPKEKQTVVPVRREGPSLELTRQILINVSSVSN